MSEINLMELVEYFAKKHDGHFTLMKFTTEWKAMFFTPDLDSGKGRAQVKQVVAGGTAEEATLIALRKEMES